MRTVKWSAVLSGICGVAAALTLTVSAVHAQSGDLTVERGASILAFPKVLSSGASDTIITIGNTQNVMVHARCFYVDAQLPDGCAVENAKVGCVPRWQETDFDIWLTKQQPTHWRASVGRIVNNFDSCFTDSNQVDPTLCENAGDDPGSVPPVQEGFVGELKCVQVDSDMLPIGGNALKGEATVKTGGDVAKYNAVGFEGTALAGETGNDLLLNLPHGLTIDDPSINDIGAQYSACPETLIVNHFAQGVTDPVVFENLRGGVCEPVAPPEGSLVDDMSEIACNTDQDCCTPDGAECPVGVCVGGPQILDPATGALSLRSATITDLTLIPCSEDFEEQQPATVTVQFEIFNEFEQMFSASTTITCWKNFFLYEVNNFQDPSRSVFSYATLGTTVAQTRVTPVGGTNAWGVIGVQGEVRADRDQNVARTLNNLHYEGDRFTASGGTLTDHIIMSDIF